MFLEMPNESNQNKRANKLKWVIIVGCIVHILFSITIITILTIQTVERNNRLARDIFVLQMSEKNRIEAEFIIVEPDKDKKRTGGNVKWYLLEYYEPSSQSKYARQEWFFITDSNLESCGLDFDEHIGEHFIMTVYTFPCMRYMYFKPIVSIKSPDNEKVYLDFETGQENTIVWAGEFFGTKTRWETRHYF